MNKNLDKIDHIVVIMLENRSFDQMLGYLYTDQKNISDAGQPYEGLTGKETCPYSQNGKITEVPVSRISTSDPYNYVMPGADPGEGYPDTIEQLYGVTPKKKAGLPAPPAEPNKGFVNNFAGKALPEDKDRTPPIYPGTKAENIMGMFTPELLPITSALAKGYAVCDHWYCSIPTETLPNRAFIHMATSQGVLWDSVYNAQGKRGPNVYDAKTIYEEMDKKGISWKMYACENKADTLPNYTHAKSGIQYLIDAPAANFGLFSEFKKEVADGTIADYTFLEPAWGATGNSMHPNYNVAAGEEFLQEIYSTLRSNPKVWEKTLLIVTFDEHGGNYDHVFPPRTAAQPDSESVDKEYGFDFTQFGVRVPTILISPWIEKGTVFRVPEGSTPMDHTSVLATLEAKYDLKPLTARDKAAPHVGAALSRSTPRPESDNPLAKLVAPKYTPPVEQKKHAAHLETMAGHLAASWPYKGKEWDGTYPTFGSSQEARKYYAERYENHFLKPT